MRWSAQRTLRAEVQLLDLTEDRGGNVGIVDFLALLGEWDQVGTPCDIDSGGVGINDFLALLANWGRCPR